MRDNVKWIKRTHQLYFKLILLIRQWQLVHYVLHYIHASAIASQAVLILQCILTFFFIASILFFLLDNFNEMKSKMNRRKRVRHTWIRIKNACLLNDWTWFPIISRFIKWTIIKLSCYLLLKSQFYWHGPSIFAQIWHKSIMERLFSVVRMSNLLELCREQILKNCGVLFEWELLFSGCFFLLLLCFCVWVSFGKRYFFVSKRTHFWVDKKMYALKFQVYPYPWNLMRPIIERHTCVFTVIQKYSIGNFRDIDR